jgi:hypothetical protein
VPGLSGLAGLGVGHRDGGLDHLDPGIGVVGAVRLRVQGHEREPHVLVDRPERGQDALHDAAIALVPVAVGVRQQDLHGPTSGHRSPRQAATQRRIRVEGFGFGEAPVGRDQQPPDGASPRLPPAVAPLGKTFTSTSLPVPAPVALAMVDQRTVAKTFGYVFVAIGVLGFVPNPLVSADGLFQLNATHNTPPVTTATLG